MRIVQKVHNWTEQFKGFKIVLKVSGQLVEYVSVWKSLEKCLDIDDFAFLICRESYSVLFVRNLRVPEILQSGRFLLFVPLGGTWKNAGGCAHVCAHPRQGRRGAESRGLVGSR